ncbi:MAG: hypothetical protein M3Y58_19690 [Chloroflexota bacterium]|nr:hypothetical protein [Chloroflexota bacterium]
MTGKITGQRLAAIALLQLDGSERAIGMEDLAMKMAELAPGRFRWKKYPEQINIGSVHSAAKLLLVTDPPYVTGGVRDGWMLTPAGIHWACQTPGIASAPVLASLARGGALLRQSDAWEKFARLTPEEITVYDARRFLKVDEYTSRRRRKERVQAIRNIAAHDDDLDALVAYLRDHFPEEWR